MSLRWFQKRTPRVDAVELGKQAESSLQDIKDQQPHVNTLIAYLENRKGQNGFGEDFDVSIRYPRRV